jgi:hypothetical protein
MRSGSTAPIPAWKLPFIVAAIAVSIVAGFYLGGPGLGMAVGGLAAATIVVLAVRKPPLYPIEPPTPPEFRRHILILVTAPLEDPKAVDSLLQILNPAASVPEPRILLAAPAGHSRLARWTSVLESGRERARRTLVLSAASLAKAGIEAGARLSDEGIVRSVEDELRTFPATEVFLFTKPGQAMKEDIDDLEDRLAVPLRRIAAPLREIHEPARFEPRDPERAREGVR